MENECPPDPSGRPAAVDLVSECARSIGQIMVPYGPRAVTWGAVDRGFFGRSALGGTNQSVLALRYR
jgi:hypothetical protein